MPPHPRSNFLCLISLEVSSNKGDSFIYEWYISLSASAQCVWLCVYSSVFDFMLFSSCLHILPESRMWISKPRSYYTFSAQSVQTE